MKLSERKQMELYNAIYGPIIELRVQLNRQSTSNGIQLDEDLFELTSSIWSNVKNTLKLEEPPK